MSDLSHKLQLEKEEMKQFGYKVIDTIVEHFDTENAKKPVALASREDMDLLFKIEAPENPTHYQEVLNFVVEKVLPNSTIVTHPKSYSFVPGPSNYVSVMADTLATGFNVFSGGWAASPAAAELEIISFQQKKVAEYLQVVVRWQILQLLSLPEDNVVVAIFQKP